MKKAKNFIPAAAGAVLAAGAVCGAGFLYRIAAARKAPRLKLLDRAEKDYIHGAEDFSADISAGKQWLREAPHEDVSIRSFDGLRLCGHLYLAEGAKRVVIMFHGFRSSWLRDFGVAARELYSAGCSLLIVEQRAHGSSEGKYISYGILERFDCRSWAEYAAKRFGDMPLYLDGVSMGASTVLMASGLKLPASVRGIIADCGYTSPRAIIDRVFKEKSPVPAAGIVSAVDLFSGFAAGYRFDDYSTLDAMKTNTLPIFFAHGDADNFVPLEMTLENYEACTAPKTLLVAHGAAHGLSYLIAHDEYYDALMDFFASYDPPLSTGQ